MTNTIKNTKNKIKTENKIQECVRRLIPSPIQVLSLGVERCE